MTARKSKKAEKNILEKIVKQVYDTASEVYGVIALVPSKTLVDDIDVLLKKENYCDGVAVRLVKDGYDITVHCILAYGSSISEVIIELQEHIKYALEKKLKVAIKHLNVFIKDIK